jgi:DNA gyrase subunit B
VKEDALKTMLSDINKYTSARNYPLLKFLPSELLFWMLENRTESTELASDDAANAFSAKLKGLFPKYEFSVESHPEEDRYVLLINDPEKVTTASDADSFVRITVETLDSLEFQRLGDLRPKVEPFLPSEQRPLMLVIGGKEEREIQTIEDLKFYVEERGKKGAQLQRFKGLGEMMPQQLWDTTMNPDTRTLLKVEIDEAATADKMFDILMGERVEPRRHFIETNAASVKNLDV